MCLFRRHLCVEPLAAKQHRDQCRDHEKHSGADRDPAHAFDAVGEKRGLREREKPLAADLRREPEGKRDACELGALVVVVRRFDDEAVKRHGVEGVGRVKAERHHEQMPEKIAGAGAVRKPPDRRKQSRDWKRTNEHQRPPPAPLRAEVIGELAEQRIEHRVPDPLDEDDRADERRVKPQRHVKDGIDEHVQRAVRAVGHHAPEAETDLFAKRDAILLRGLVVVLWGRGGRNP